MEESISVQIEVSAHNSAQTARLARSLRTALLDASAEAEVSRTGEELRVAPDGVSDGGATLMVNLLSGAASVVAQAISWWQIRNGAVSLKVKKADVEIHIENVRSDDVQKVLEKLLLSGLPGDPGQLPFRLPKPPDADRD